MTLVESMDVLGNLGELIGAIAVLVTLGYLTVQVKQNTQALRFQSGRESARLHVDIAIGAMQPDVSETLARASSGAELSDVQLSQLDQFVYAWMSALHQDYLEYRAGFQTEAWWRVRESTIAMVLSPASARSIWVATGKQYWSADFNDVVAGILQRSPTFDYIARARADQ